MSRYIIQSHILALVLIYIVPFLCFNIMGEKYEGQGGFLHVSFISFFFYTPGIVVQFVIMMCCNLFFEGRKKYGSIGRLLLFSIDILLTIFLLLLFANMRTPHNIGNVLHIFVNDTLYWTLTLIMCKLYMLIRLIIMYSREYPEDL